MNVLVRRSLRAAGSVARSARAVSAILVHNAVGGEAAAGEVRMSPKRMAILGWVLLMAVVTSPLHAAKTPQGPADQDTPMARTGPYVGRLLVATPRMGDPRFAKTVILMLEHRVDGIGAGAMGLIIYRFIGQGPVGKLLDGSGATVDGATAEKPVSLHFGGPVEGYLGFILHSGEYPGTSDSRTVKGMAEGTVIVSTDVGLLAKIATGAGPKNSLFLMGYAGWGPGQLEREIAEGAWVLIPGDAGLVFGADRGEALWRKAWERRGLEL